jgi:two-component system cell cycle sensor histidine kinase/response regulator CckA
LRSANILVVEDDEPIADLVMQALVPHNVTAVFDGEEALRLLRSRTPFDLLITDCILPGRYDGFALARQAKALRPQLEILYASGYFSKLPTGDHDTFYGRFLAKPYRIGQLRLEVQRALGLVPAIAPELAEPLRDIRPGRAA